jgi:acyl phosphate:glycerol-3-phosphate acyltransferase
MEIVYNIGILVLAYLIGSIPTSVWIGKSFHGIDVREHGSGNAGATNTIRVLGWKTGIPVLLIDMGKGFIAALLPVIFHRFEPHSQQMINFQIISGSIAILGHVFPLYSGFRGGKGVASTIGVLLAVAPFVTLSCLGVFMIVLLMTGYVSLSSISFGIAFPLIQIFVFDTPSIYLKTFSMLIAFALIITHKKNISRLIKGEESKFIGKKKKG